MVNFIYQLAWAKGCPRTWLNILLGMSARVRLEEISISTGGLSKADAPPPWGWASFTMWRAWIEQNCRGRLHLLSAWRCNWDIDLPPSMSWLSGLQTQTGIYTICFLAPRLPTTPPAFLGERESARRGGGREGEKEREGDGAIKQSDFLLWHFNFHKTEPIATIFWPYFSPTGACSWGQREL